MGKNGLLITRITIKESITDETPPVTEQALENYRRQTYSHISKDVDMEISTLQVDVEHVTDEEVQ